MANGAGSTNRNYNSPLGSPLGTKINVAIFLFCALGGLITGCILLAVGLQRQQFFNALNPTSSSCGVDPCGDFSTQPGQCTILDVYQRNILKSEKNGKKGMKDVCYAQLSYEFTGPFAKATGDSILRPSSQEIVAALNTPGAMDHFNDKGGDTMGLKRYGGWKLARRPWKALSRLESTTAFAGRVAMSRVESIRLHDGECDFPQDSPKDASSTKNGYFQRGGETGDEKAEDYGGKSSMESFWVGDETDCWQANDVIHVQKTAVIDGINAYLCLDSEAMNPACVKLFDPAQEVAFQAGAAGGLWLAGAILLPIFFIFLSIVYALAFRCGGDVFKVFTCQLLFSGKPCGDCSRSLRRDTEGTAKMPDDGLDILVSVPSPESLLAAAGVVPVGAAPCLASEV